MHEFNIASKKAAGIISFFIILLFVMTISVMTAAKIIKNAIPGRGNPSGICRDPATPGIVGTQPPREL